MLPRWITWRRSLAAALVVGLLSTGTWIYVVAARLGHITNQSPLSVIGDVLSRGGNSDVHQSLADGKRIILALYGYGGPDHDGGYLSDSIMLVVIQPHSDGAAQVAEVSVPRDWYVPIDLGNGHKYFGRVNEAYADAQANIYPNRADIYKGPDGGAKLANATLEKVLGVHVDHYVGVDFHAFEYAVDAVGGIDVTVEHSFTDPEYPRGECNGGQGDCRIISVHFDAGPQHMDGKRALIFARSRHSPDNGEGSDFARSRRQQLVLQAVRDKVVSVSGLTRLPAVLDALGDHVVTDLTVGDAYALYDAVKDVSPANVEHVSIDDQNFLYECGYPANCAAAYLYAHDPSYATIARFLQNVIPDRAALAEKLPVTIYDASGAGGVASARWTSLLRALGFDARDGGARPLSATTVVSQTGASASSLTAGWLTTYFGAGTTRAAASTAAPAGTTASPPATAAPPGIALVLGSDEERAFSPRGAASVYGSVAPAPTRGPAPAPTATPTRPPGTPPPTPSPTPCLVGPPVCKGH